MLSTTTAADQAPAGAAPSAAAILGLDRSFPIDAAATEALVNAGAYFSLFSLPNPASPNQPVPLIPALGDAPLWFGFKVSEDLHRFEVEEQPPTAVCGLRIRQKRSQSGVAAVKMEMIPMPNYFRPGPNRMPAPTLLLPFLAQRFMPHDGSIHFKDAAASGFSAVGAGHTYPASGSPRLIAVLDIAEGFGDLAGSIGTGIVSGGIDPPFTFAFSVLFRIVDPSGNLQAKVPPGPIRVASDPTPQTSTVMGTSFIQLLGEQDPQHPITVEPSADGKSARVTITDTLRLLDMNFNVDPPGLRSHTTVGKVVGRHRTTLHLDLTKSEDVIPAYSEGDEFTFFDDSGQTIGGFRADTSEARVMRTVEAGGAMFRLGGYALPTEGHGQFTDPVGQVSINGAFSPVTGTASTAYMIRLVTPDAVFKVVA